METLARVLMTVGGLLILGGVMVWVAARMGLPLGRLPGDLSWRGRNATVFFPLGTSLLVSVVLSLLFWVIGRMRH
ncbi:MAG TPA: DUF2905 domain-containing protein [Acidobacteriaceae bacterium]